MNNAGYASEDESLAAIVSAVAEEWQVGGMGPDSMYGEFAIEVAKRALRRSAGGREAPLAATIKAAETMANTGASAMHVVELFRALESEQKACDMLRPVATGKLEKPAMVGSTRFGVGVSERLVIDRAQREYEYQVTPEKEAERMKQVRSFVQTVGNIANEDQPARDERLSTVATGHPWERTSLPAEPTRAMLDAWYDEMRGVAHNRPSTVWPGLHYSDHESLMVNAYQAMLSAAPAESRLSAIRTCDWRIDKDGVWHTGCGQAWVYTDSGTPKDHGALFCYHCGGSMTCTDSRQS